MSKTGRKTGKTIRRRKAKASPKGAMWPWYLAGLVVIGGISAYDNLSTLQSWFRPPVHLAASGEQAPKPVKRQSGEAHTAAIPAPGRRSFEEAVQNNGERTVQGLMPPQDIPAMQTVALRTGPAGPFYYCTDQKTNCVIDGGSFWFKGQKIGLADISLPQMKKAKCDAERELGSRAKRRLRDILNVGEFKILAANDAAGKMHVVLSDGTLISDRLISEGLAHSPKDAAKPWC